MALSHCQQIKCHLASAGKMLDPLTVLSLASNIIQFVDFSNKVIVASSQL
jgi:hypothetical protein